LAGWKSILEDGVLRIPYSVHARFSFVDLEDVAQAAAVVLTEPNHFHAIYELAGTPPMSHVDVARMFGQVLQREIRAETEEIGDWRFRASVTSKYAMDSLVKMFAYYDQWGLAGNPNVLSWLLKGEPTSVQLFIERTMQERNIIS
jgi:nucleoside-diphosphate-sugar epimerase